MMLVLKTLLHPDDLQPLRRILAQPLVGYFTTIQCVRENVLIA